MKILFIGDIYGRPGREMVAKVLPEIKKEHAPNLIFANAENLTHGDGFTPEHIEEMQKAGISYFTAGNRLWKNHSGVMQLNNPNFPVLRPANYPDQNTPGRGYAILEDNMMNKVLLINIMGRVFMKQDLDCPFRTADKILRELSYEKFSAIIIDFHAEATSEKTAFGFYLDGRVSAVLGTHTHVPTCDYRVLDKGTAYISDIGMSGIVDSIIGVKKDLIINRFLTQIPSHHEPETEGKRVFNAVMVELDSGSGKALNIQHIQKYF